MQLGEESQGDRQLQASPTPTHEPHTGDQVHTRQQNRLRNGELVQRMLLAHVCYAIIIIYIILY